MQNTQKYIAAYIPRYIRQERLWHLPPEAVIGSKVFQNQGSNMIYDIVMLPDQQFIRARYQLGLAQAYKLQLSMGSWSPVFIPKHVREITLSLTEPHPFERARAYFRQAFGLDEASSSRPQEDFRRVSHHINQDERKKAEEQRQHSHDPYIILGITESMSNAEIKRRYRAIIRKYHPDIFAAAGLTPGKIAQANEEMKRINGAYDTIRRARGIK